MGRAVKILIMGLPGAGKTTLANALRSQLIDVEWLNADEVRARFNDWDFTHEGRIRQSKRMAELANESRSTYVIADFVAPLPEMRDNFAADWVVWVNTLVAGRFEDTNKVFVPPEKYDFLVSTQSAEEHAKRIARQILMNKLD